MQTVIPAKAGIQAMIRERALDSRLHGSDGRGQRVEIQKSAINAIPGAGISGGVWMQTKGSG